MLERSFDGDNNGMGYNWLANPAVDLNSAKIIGRIEDEIEFSHETNWERFFKTRVRVTRLSGTDDFVPILVSNYLLNDNLVALKGKLIEVSGELRSYNINNKKDGRSHLELFLFAKNISFYGHEEDLKDEEEVNTIQLIGNLCKPPIYMVTPFGRQITNLMLAVNRDYHKASYIPCITWGRMAIWASKLEVGDKIELYGRIQSRKYWIRVSPDSENGEYRTVYEVSVSRIKKIE